MAENPSAGVPAPQGSEPRADATIAAPPPALRGQVRQGIAWSATNNLVLRAGNLLVGILLARLVSPEAFGVFAIGLTIQAVLVNLADMGLNSYLVRSDRLADDAPTVATVGLVSGALLAGLMTLTAVPTARALGSPSASPVIAVLSLTLVLSGVAVVPTALLLRNFQQQKVFAVDGTSFVVGTALTVGLVVLGLGPMALALSRLGAQGVATALSFLLARVRPRFGFHVEVARSAVRFGAPLALANMLSWALLNIDNIVVSRVCGVVSLGFYVLAFNVSSWPMTAVGLAVRPVALAGFARQKNEDPAPSMVTAVGLSAAAGAQISMLLGVLALPIVTVLYGDRWAPSATALAGLAVFGGLRLVTDLMATFLTARGAVSAVLVTQACWLVALTPTMILGTQLAGLAGAGWAHVAVGFLVVLPVYLVAVRRYGVPPGALLRRAWPPLAAAVPAGAAVYTVSQTLHSAWAVLLIGGSVGTLVFVACLFRWGRRLISSEATGSAVGPPSLQAA